MLAEAVIRDSGLPYAMLGLAASSRPTPANLHTRYLVLMRATPGDNRMHTVDARDVALAFANAVDRADAINGKVLLIAATRLTCMPSATSRTTSWNTSALAGSARRRASRVTPTTTAAGVSPVSSTPPSLRTARVPTAQLAGNRCLGRRGAGQAPHPASSARPGDPSADAAHAGRAAAGRTTRPVRRPVDADRQQVRSRRAGSDRLLMASSIRRTRHWAGSASRPSSTAPIRSSVRCRWPAWSIR